MIFKPAMVSLWLGALAGCSPNSPNREETVASCQLDALKTFPNENQRSPKIETFLQLCMASKGYRINLAPTDCKGSWTVDLYATPACYELAP